MRCCRLSLNARCLHLQVSIRKLDLFASRRNFDLRGAVLLSPPKLLRGQALSVLAALLRGREILLLQDIVGGSVEVLEHDIQMWELGGGVRVVYAARRPQKVAAVVGFERRCRLGAPPTLVLCVSTVLESLCRLTH